MTERLYQKDPYLVEFEAIVLSCEKDEKRDDSWKIVLDRSAFFPEGGGQPADTGLLFYKTAGINPGAEPDPEGTCLSCRLGSEARSVEVSDAHERGKDIVLTCNDQIPAGGSVKGRINWTRRFEHMQNHSGEHIVSGLIHRRFGYNNVGFHMAEELMTIDLDGRMTEADMREIEEKANRIVWKNVEIRTDYYTEEEAEKIEFRSKKELHGTISVVTIPGADVCACCGTHVRRTGEIGPIRLFSIHNFKNGVRIEMACGSWALKFMTAVLEQNHRISGLLSAKPLETADAVERLLAESRSKEEKITEMNFRKIRELAEEAKAGENVLVFADTFRPQLLQRLTDSLMEATEGGLCAAFSENGKGGFHYAIGQRGGNLKELVSEMNAKLDGKGGGKPFFMQGNLTASKEEIRTFLKSRSGFSEMEV